MRWIMDFEKGGVLDAMRSSLWDVGLPLCYPCSVFFKIGGIYICWSGEVSRLVLELVDVYPVIA